MIVEDVRPDRWDPLGVAICLLRGNHHVGAETDLNLQAYGVRYS
jgi:drug/metabolite transporter superfamily protein YnfA